MTDNKIINGFCSFDAKITKTFFYGYCRRAYDIYDYKYQLRHKTGLDFYSLAHEYYIYLLKHAFKPLLDKPKDKKLSTWMTQGFHFVVLDALKAYNKEFEHQSEEAADVILEYVLSTDPEEGMLLQVVEAVKRHYRDRLMTEVAHLVFYEGFKQKEVATQFKLTPAAINQRYKKMMEEVVTPFVMEHYGKGLQSFTLADTNEMEAPVCATPKRWKTYDRCQQEVQSESPTTMRQQRLTPPFITTLKANEIFVFGSNLQGIHAGGAARTARLHFGAIMGNGVGMQGQSYAIPTMQGGTATIRPYVDEFIAYASQHQTLHFLVTPIGCGIAGFEPKDIAPLFAAAAHIENISLPAEFWEIIDN